jgi:hypothetical protein
LLPNSQTAQPHLSRPTRTEYCTSGSQGGGGLLQSRALIDMVGVGDDLLNVEAGRRHLVPAGFPAPITSMPTDHTLGSGLFHQARALAQPVGGVNISQRTLRL